MIVRKLRLQKGWSQGQLAQFSGLSIRTIQRIERGQKGGLESLKALAAVFEVQLNDLQQETDMIAETQKPEDELKIIEHVRDIKGFYTHLIQYVVMVGALFILNILTNPEVIWTLWVALGWGMGVIYHGLSVYEVFNFLGPDWEKKQIEKRLGRKI